MDLLRSKDDLTPMMLRVHLVTESLLERLIIAYLPKGSGLIEKGNLSYHQKLEVANSFEELDSLLIGALRQLNKVRNSASHSREASVNRAQIEQIGRPLGSGFTEIRREHGTNNEQFAMAMFAIIFAKFLNLVPRGIRDSVHEEFINPDRNLLWIGHKTKVLDAICF